MYSFIFIYLSIRGEPFMDLDHVKVFCVWIPPPCIQEHNRKYTNPYIHECCTYMCSLLSIDGTKKRKEKKKKPPLSKNPPNPRKRAQEKQMNQMVNKQPLNDNAVIIAAPTRSPVVIFRVRSGSSGLGLSP